MKLLVLGGTKFLGRHLVVEALRRGDLVTLFHRGRTGPDLFPEVRHVLGDRDGELDRLPDERWDAVIDTSGYVPRVVGDAARALADRAAYYAFVSSISVYPTHPAGLREAPVPARDPGTETVDGTTYGPLKALCEEAVTARFGARALIVRAGLIVGPWDPTDRFTYWVRRIAMGGEILAPLPEERPIQVIHAGDLAAWMLDMAARGRGGVFHATAPQTPHTMRELLETCREVGGGTASWRWAPESFFLDAGVRFWQELPLCVPDPDHGVLAVDVTRALGEGLRPRSLAHTVRDTLAWDARRPPGVVLGAGLTAEREAELRRKLDARAG